MKKKVFALIFVFALLMSLAGCDFLVLEATSKKTITTKEAQERTIDYNSIVSDIYNDIYQKIEADLYDQIYEEVVKNGGVTIEELQNEIYKVVDMTKDGNIGITNYKAQENGKDAAYATGSAVIFDPTGIFMGEYDKEVTVDGVLKHRYYFITNHHVVEGGASFRATFSDGTDIKATLLGSDETTDIALLYFDSEKEYKELTLGSSGDLKVGDFILAVGNPKGETLFGSVSFGIVGGLNRNLKEEDGTTNMINEYIQHDAAINSGNSGGGLYNLDGECIGINSVKYASSDIEGLNFAIPIDLVKNVVKEIKEYGSYTGTVSYGVSILSLEDILDGVDLNNITKADQEMLDYYHIPAGVSEGVLVAEVAPGKSCEGIVLPYDIIIKVDDKNIKNSADLSASLKEKHIGDSVTMVVLRGGVETTLTITFIRTK